MDLEAENAALRAEIAAIKSRLVSLADRVTLKIIAHATQNRPFSTTELWSHTEEYPALAVALAATNAWQLSRVLARAAIAGYVEVIGKDKDGNIWRCIDDNSDVARSTDIE